MCNIIVENKWKRRVVMILVTIVVIVYGQRITRKVIWDNNVL